MGAKPDSNSSFPPQPVRAAGGVIARVSDEGRTEVLLIHRPRYGDWTFPKGKLHPGESHEQCAVREVEEETGFRCKLLKELTGTSYRDHRDRPKTVRYWQMEIVSGQFKPTEEVDGIRWLPLREASKLLSYGHDLAMLEEIAGVERREGA